MDLSVVVVSHNHAPYLPACLASLATGAGRLQMEAFVVDNCSTDGSAEVARAYLPQVRLLRSPTPRGFAANNNAAIRLSRGRFVALLNPDTVAGERAFETLVQFMQAHTDVGI